MTSRILRKEEDLDPRPNLVDYEAACRSWSWESERARLTGLPDGGGLNIAFEAVDRHVASGHGRRTALRLLSRSAGQQDLTYAALAGATNQFANALERLGLGSGDVVATLTGRLPALYVSALGALKAKAVFSPLFSAFGPEPVRARLALSRARLLVTSELLYRRKVEPVREQLPDLEYVLLTGALSSEDLPAGTAAYTEIVGRESAEYQIAPTDPQEPALLHFTSGTTGTPKAAVHVHEAVVVHHATGRLALDLSPGTVFWCTADPGWVTGVSYGIIAPLSIGATAVVDQEEFEADRWYETLETQEVEVWYTAPTAIRMLQRSGTDLAGRREYPRLRHLASVGEPLEAEAVEWGVEAFGKPFHDTWWQTETGGIMVANYPAADIRPGSMGRPFPGIDAAIIRRQEERFELVEVTNEVGELALRRGWPSMFRDYRGSPERYADCFLGDWYLSGDLVRRDEAGHFWFVGRVDDAIQSAGHLIGPFEIEATMMEHPAVADAAAVGVPDPVAFEVVAACIVLRPEVRPDEALERELLAHARRKLGPAVAPRVLTFHSALPRTPSGKILRRELREAAAKRFSGS